ncbi:neutral/alkaline non-lysosomal ceramidase N-terminal domain-containing protein [Ravibacter arvi]
MNIRRVSQDFKRTAGKSWLVFVLLLATASRSFCLTESPNPLNSEKMNWQVGLSRRVITPKTDVWLAGYGTKRSPEGKLHDVWVKVMVLKDSRKRSRILVTTDHQGMSKTIYKRLFERVAKEFKVERADFMLTFSHNHSGPCLQDDLVDYYPSDSLQKQRVLDYTLWMEDQVIEAVREAWHHQQPAQLFKGEGLCTFAVNRRENKEAEVPAMLESGTPLKGPVDHAVPVLAIKSPKGRLLGVLFGYACHPTTLSHNLWSGDYPGYAQAGLEKQYPGAQAMFFNTCGGDQNPLPRRTVALCEKYGKMLADAVIQQLNTTLTPVSPALTTAFAYVQLDYEEVATREKLIPIAFGSQAIQARWAKRMVKKLDDGETFSPFYEYPVQAWQIGRELLLIGIGGEAVVDYSLRFKKEYPGSWVSGYTNEMAAYIPSRRVWEEDGYEGGAHLDEYGRPAWRWAGDIEDRIAATVKKLVEETRKP